MIALHFRRYVMGNIIASRTVAENILLNKHGIRALPFYEYPNSKALDIYHDDGFRQIRTMRNYPVGYDFSCNIIAEIRKAGLTQKVIKEGVIGDIPYYFAWINLSHIYEYTASAGDHTKRQGLIRKLQNDITTGFVTVRGGTDKEGRYLTNIAPFRVIETRKYENGDIHLHFAWAKDIFETLITDTCTKAGADGYITLPDHLYPLSTQATVAAETLNKIAQDDNSKVLETTGRTHLIGSSNPIYKLEVYARMKNTNELPSMQVDRKELLKAIVPELTDKDGNLRKIAASELHNILIREVQDIRNKTTGVKVLSNFYLGKAWESEQSILYFK